MAAPRVGTATSKLVWPVPAGEGICTSAALKMTVPVATSSVENVTARHGPAVWIVTAEITGGVSSGTAAVSKAPMSPRRERPPAPVERARAELDAAARARRERAAEGRRVAGATGARRGLGNGRRRLPAHAEGGRREGHGRGEAHGHAREVHGHARGARQRVDERAGRRPRPPIPIAAGPPAVRSVSGVHAPEVQKAIAGAMTVAMNDAGERRERRTWPIFDAARAELPPW